MIAGVPLELPHRVARASDYVVRWVGRQLGRGVEDAHNYGRAVDALFKAAAVTGADAPAETVQGLRDALLGYTDNPLAMPLASGEVNPHDLREIIQAFAELGFTAGDAEVRDRLGRLLDAMLQITKPDGSWDAAAICSAGLDAPGFRDGESVEGAAPRVRGRTITALTYLCRLSGDDRALELAQRFVRLCRTRAFDDDGRLTVHAGTHTHSITGTVHGLADYGVLVGDLDTLEHARRILDRGLAGTCSSFGWSIETLGDERVPSRGEINNTGDMAQAAILIGLAGYPAYFGRAERMLRSHLLPSQWLHGQEILAPADAPEYAVATFPDESDGGWGFPTPSDLHVPDPLFLSASILDVTQGGIQVLWSAMSHAATRHGQDTRLNLFLPGSLSAATIEGSLESPERVAVTLADRGRLWVRKPGWLEWQQLVLSAGSPAASGPPVAFAQVGEWAVTEPLAAHTAVAVEVPQVEQSHEEWIYWQRYRMTFAGDTIVAMEPRGTYAPMFPPLKE